MINGTWKFNKADVANSLKRLVLMTRFLEHIWTSSPMGTLRKAAGKYK